MILAQNWPKIAEQQNPRDTAPLTPNFFNTVIRNPEIHMYIYSKLDC